MFQLLKELFKVWKNKLILYIPYQADGVLQIGHGNKMTGQGWCSTLEDFDGLMGVRNTRTTLSPLHSELEAFMWAIECMRNLHQFQI